MMRDARDELAELGRPPLAGPPPVRLVKRSLVAGHVHGLRQPAAMVWLDCRVDSPVAWGVLRQRLVESGCRMPTERPTTALGIRPKAQGHLSSLTAACQQTLMDGLTVIADALLATLEEAGLVVADAVALADLQPATADGDAESVTVLLVVPCLAPPAAVLALNWLVGWICAAATGGDAARHMVGWRDLLAQLQPFAHRGTNTRLLLLAAYERGVPVRTMPLGCLQLGWGARSRWLDTTATDETSNIALKLARDKVAANAWMRQGGLPVPVQAVVRSKDQALKQAREWGWPVAIKPAALDGGVGVAAGLNTEDELSAAYDRARQHSDYLVLEQHIPGTDYRVGVIGNRVGWVTRREPAGVWGDGVHTLQALMDHVNAEPYRGTQSWALVPPLTLNDEAHELLRAQQMGLDSVPPAGQFVRLRRSANISSGGRPIDMTADIHPDNAALAERAAQLFKLDFAGVDLIMPDITRSWREVGGAICEINAKPQFSVAVPQAVHEALDFLLVGSGRIPLAVLLGQGAWDDDLQRLAQDLSSEGHVLGVCTPGGRWVGGVLQQGGQKSAFNDVQAMLVDTRVTAVVVQTDGLEWLRTGLPFDRFDLLLAYGQVNRTVVDMLQTVCATPLRPVSAQGGVGRNAALRALASLLPEMDRRPCKPLSSASA